MNPDGSADLNTVSLYETASGLRLKYAVIDGSAGTAALKITSHAQDVDVTVGTLIGGSENCVDLNNGCRNIAVHCDDYQCRGKYAISAKTCSDTSFTGHISGRATQWEINLGSWSDQSSNPQTNTKLALTADHYPIRVWVGNALIPDMDDPAKYKLIGFGRHGTIVRELVMMLWGLAKKLKLA